MTFPGARKPEQSIRKRMLTVSLLLVLLPASAIIICSLFLGMRSATRLSVSQLESVATVKEAGIDNLLREMQSYVANTATGAKTYESILVLLQKNGDAAEVDSASLYLRNRFLAALAASDTFEEFLLTTMSGGVVLSTAQGNRWASLSLIRASDGSAGEPMVRLVSNQLFCSKPVKNREGAIVGVVWGRATLGSITKIMQERSGLGATGETYLVAADDTLLTPSRFAQYPTGIQVRSEGSQAAIRSRGHGDGVYTDYRGQTVVGVYRWLPELQAALLAEQDQAEILSPIHRGAVINLAVALAALLLAGLASIRFSRSITDPIEELAGTAERVAAGDLELRAKVEREDEIGTLAHSFNSMTRQLRDVIEKLRDSETKYRIVADNTYDWEFWRRPDGEFIYVSPSCERISGYKPGDFYADSTLIERITHEDDRQAFREHQLLALRGELPSYTEIEFRIVSADGSLHWMSHVCASVHDQEGRFLGKRGTNRDITLEKETQAQLLEAKEQAEAANRAKSAFISSMSHELRTPLNAIIGYTQILLCDESLTKTQRDQLETLRKSGEHLLSLINDILDVATIESGRMNVEEAAVDLGALLREVLVEARSKAREKGLHFRVELGSELPAYVSGDGRKVKTVLANLLDNAVRFTQQGAVTLRLAYDRGADAALRCEVSDTGTGIPAGKLEEVFQPFTQLVREGMAREGTGLGLTIVRHLVLLMRGNVEVESEPGKGSTFRVTLPMPQVGEGEVLLTGQLPEEPAGEATAAAAEEQTELQAPADKLQELYELAMLGDMRRIATWAEDLMESDSRYIPFGTTLRELAQGFKAKAILDLVEKHMPEKQHGR
jgi:PAS domain S-box-containing protein